MKTKSLDGFLACGDGWTPGSMNSTEAIKHATEIMFAVNSPSSIGFNARCRAEYEIGGFALGGVHSFGFNTDALATYIHRELYLIVHAGEEI